MACPYFMPVEKQDPGWWVHPGRLPLGAGWKGRCTAPGYEAQMPSEEQLRHSCNLGYAHNCPWRPQERQWDSTRFGVSKESEQRITLRYVCEKDHRPVQHGNLEYELLLSRWTCTHPDTRLQRMAECYLESYLLKKSITP